MKKAAGYTIDQTILIVAVIAVLITLIIASVGWDLLNRTSGTKFASYLKQIEEANGAFYARQGVWPHTAVADAAVAPAAGIAENNIAVLAVIDPLGGANANDYADRFKPFLTGFDVVIDTADSDANVSHEFGSGGIISQEVLAGGVAAIGGGTCDAIKDVMLITLEGVPEPELQNADEAIDGEIDRAVGRLQWSAPAAGVATATYCGNLLN